MRRDFIYNLLLGGAIGVLALVLHFFTAGATPLFQFALLALAGALLFAMNLALALRRNRQAHPEDDFDDEPAAVPDDRRNPFFRELTSDWTGLDEYPAGSEPVRAARPETGAKRPTDDRDMV